MSQKNNPILSLLGLCARGRNLVSGGFAVEKAIKDGGALIVIVAKDASDNTQKKFKDMCSYRNIPIYLYSDKEVLGHAIGQEERSSIAILDPGFSKNLAQKLDSVEAMEVVDESK